MFRPLLAAIINTLTPDCDTAPAADTTPDVDVRETCSCGASLMLEGPFDNQTLTEWIDRWRTEHPCQPGDKNATHIGTGASTERAWSEPHRSDSAMKAPLGFTWRRPDPASEPQPSLNPIGAKAPVGFVLYPPMGRVVASAGVDPA